ncbi:MAG: response regulator containing a CheY-like receiver domain and an DNA-binding domain [Firmicutes bacterium]|nr:response regulator containing a CheY-like receiver domain and an DNA-binding domain [Bacillota bacterium]
MSVKVMVVDDSAFSRVMIADALAEGGYEVVGEAESIDTLIETYDSCKPDVITMDIAMPGADGFECSKNLILHDPKVKIILVSSMKDEETEQEARRIGIAGYVQKPVEAEALLTVINSVLAPDTMYQTLDEFGVGVFKEALAQSVTRMTKTTATFAEDNECCNNASQEITVVIGIIGRYSGNMIVALSAETANKMTEIILRREAKSREEVVGLAAEFANVVGGIACSMLNKKEKAFGLRVAPPSVFYGGATEVVSPNIKCHNTYADTEFGRIYLSVGFKKGSVLWM